MPTSIWFLLLLLFGAGSIHCSSNESESSNSISSLLNTLSFGSNSQGQLGLGSRRNEVLPFTVNSNFKLETIFQVSCGNEVAIALSDQGNVWAWGSNAFGGITLNPSLFFFQADPAYIKYFINQTVVSTAAGGNHFFAQTKEGDLFAWGRNDAGQLCAGDKTNSVEPRKIKLPSVNGNEAKVLQIAGGQLHTMLLVQAGNATQIMVCGSNEYGQLGLGDYDLRTTPTVVSWFQNKSVSEIAAGGYHSLAISGQRLYTWGSNVRGQLGIASTKLNTTSPSRVSCSLMTSNIVSVAGGLEHSIVATNDDKVFTWGSNGQSQLGLGSDAGLEDRPTPQQLFFTFGKIIKVVTGSAHSLVLTQKGSLFAWGWNGQGQLGLGDTKDRDSPTKVQSSEFLWTLSEVQAGDSFTIGLGMGVINNSTNPFDTETSRTQMAGIILLLIVGCIAFGGLGWYIKNLDRKKLEREERHDLGEAGESLLPPERPTVQ